MLKPRTMKESSLVATYLMLPADANPWGNVHGGVIMRRIDEAGGTVAMRHSRKRIVTASIDRMNFLKPVYVGNLLILKAVMNYTGKTSMEVGVKVEAEDLRTGKLTHTGTAYLTYVALDNKGKPTRVPPITPETEEEKRRYAEAKVRRQKRLEELGKHRVLSTKKD